MVTVTLPIFWITLLWTQPWADVSTAQRGIFLFLGVLPLINALFDVLSYAVTLTLMRMDLPSRVPWAWGLIDLAIACVLFLALGATLTILLTGMNTIAGTNVFDLGSLFAGIHTAPQDYWWLYAMVFSTILPTALHGLISLLGLQGIMPQRLRRPVVNLLRDAPASPAKAAIAPLFVGAIWLVPLVLLATAIWALWTLGAETAQAFGLWYLEKLTQLAIQVQAF